MIIIQADHQIGCQQSAENGHHNALRPPERPRRTPEVAGVRARIQDQAERSLNAFDGGRPRLRK